MGGILGAIGSKVLGALFGVVKRIMGPIGSRIAGAIAAGVAGLFVSLGLEVTPEIQQAAEQVGTAVAGAVMLAVYGLVHRAIERPGKKQDATDG
ncbi:MAG TPA: hypothetical protein VNZ57_12735 [Longimicrobiales bacterium]|nr:hypothetical protein [Longimicrobiales bacterium]